jgi:hypothetical protein
MQKKRDYFSEIILNTLFADLTAPSKYPGCMEEVSVPAKNSLSFI